MKRLFFPLLVVLVVLLLGSGGGSVWGRGGGGFGGFHGGGSSGGAYPMGGFLFGGYSGGPAYGEGVSGPHFAMATDFGLAHADRAALKSSSVPVGHFTSAYSRRALAGYGTAVRKGVAHYGAFNAAWWRAHPKVWRPTGWDRERIWRGPTWDLLTRWLDMSAEPLSFDYGTSIVYYEGQVFIDSNDGPTAEEYYQQAIDQALAAPASPPADSGGDAWLPLGVFALVNGQQPDTLAVFQLAVDQGAILRGSCSDVRTGTTLPVRGVMNQATQRVCWVMGEQKTTVFDTGMVNLTQDESPLLAHFGKERTQQWFLVRLKEPDGGAGSVAGSGMKTSPAVDRTAQIIVVVPADAEVFFDGRATTQSGAERRFRTAELDRGSTYRYSVRAVWTHDGRPVQKTREVSFKAGSRIRVDFTDPLPTRQE